MDTVQITAEDVLRCGSPWADYEIWDGIPMLREPSGGQSEAVGSEVVYQLMCHVRERRLGRVFMSSQGFLLARNPDRLLASDGAFISTERLPRVPKRGFIEASPEFLIEVRSPTQSWEGTIEKCGLWIAHGALCAWAIDPLARRVVVLRGGVEPEIHDGSGTIDASPALPEFRVEVTTLFQGLD